MSAADPDRLGLYIHWPYCVRICPYCDFNVYKAANPDGEALFEAMLADLERWRDLAGPRPLASVHFGGGTPSLMRPAQVAALLEAAGRLFGFAPDAEIGLEANPKEAAAFAGLAAAGVERLSLGVQAFNDADLRRLGRDHGADEARRAIGAAQAAFARVSIDMIYAREGQSLEAWRSELEEAFALGLDHLSLYQLTIEPGTAFERQARRGALRPPGEDQAADLFDLTQDMTEAAGLPAYEISNHARSRAAQSAHNRLYWEGADWIGIGPGAHSRLGRADQGGRTGYTAALKPADYIKGAASGSTHAAEPLSAREEAVERILMGIRLLDDGLDGARVERITGHSPDAEARDRLARQGLVSIEHDRIRLTRAGRIYGDAIAEALVPAGQEG
ncbi:MAG: radical SAM family heme chaperone HemW [Oceanicaulis sp.]